MKAQTDLNTLILYDFSMPLFLIDKSSRQKVNKKTQNFYNITDQMGLAVIYRIFYRDYRIHILLMSHGTFSKIDLISKLPSSGTRIYPQFMN